MSALIRLRGLLQPRILAALGWAVPLLCTRMATAQDAIMVSTPPTLEFNIVDGGADPPFQSVMLSMSNGDTTEYWASGSNWRVSPLPVSGWAPSTMQVRVRAGGRPSGTYRDTLWVSGWDTVSAPLAIPITTRISPFPLSSMDTMSLVPGQVWIEHPASDTSFALAIFADLATVTTAIVIPLRYAGHPSLRIDSTVTDPPDHVGVTLGPAGRDTAWSITTSLVDPVQKTVLLGFISFSQVAPFADTLAWIHFKLDSNDVSASVRVDATLLGDNYLSICDVWAVERTPVWSDAEVLIGTPQPPISICLVPPMVIEFSAASGGPLPTPYAIEIAECHGGTLTWSVAYQPAWIDLSTQSGSNSSTLVTLSPNTTDFEPGTWLDSLVILGDHAVNNPKKLFMHYVVAPGLPKVDSIFIEPERLSIRGPYVDTAFHLSLWLYNYHVPGAVSIPLQLTGLPALRLDSSVQSSDGYPGIQWGSAATHRSISIRTFSVDPSTRKMHFGLISFGAYPAYRTAKVADIFFALDFSSAGGTATLDSTQYMGGLAITDLEATEHTPGWRPGVIVVGDSLPLPQVCLATDSLLFESIQSGVLPVDQEVKFRNCLPGALNWTAHDNANWLELTPASGTGAGGSVNFHVNTTQLPPGVHWATATIRDVSWWPSAAQVIVRHVVQPGPTDRLYMWPGNLTLPGNKDTTFTVPIMLQLVSIQAVGLVLPLTFAGSSANIQLDTLVEDQFGNRGVTQGPLGGLPIWNSLAVRHDPVARTILLGYVSFGAPLWPPAHDTLVVLHFAVDGQPGSQLFSLDTTTLPPAHVLAILDPLGSQPPVDWSGGGISIGPTDVQEDGPVALGFELEQNIPNPFNASTEIRFELPSGAAGVSLSIHDVLGRRVRSLALGPLSPGPHRRLWDGRDRLGEPVATGVYFIVLEAQSTRLVKKALLLR